MIRIDRGPEPDALVLARDEHLARARLRGGPPEELRGYDVARDVLTARQIYKCAYCELTLRHEAAPVEHYRLADHVRVARNFQVPTGEHLQPSIEQKPLTELVAEILAHRPDVTDAELGALLNRASATIRKLRR